MGRLLVLRCSFRRSRIFRGGMVWGGNEWTGGDGLEVGREGAKGEMRMAGVKGAF